VTSSWERSATSPVRSAFLESLVERETAYGRHRGTDRYRRD